MRYFNSLYKFFFEILYNLNERENKGLDGEVVIHLAKVLDFFHKNPKYLIYPEENLNNELKKNEKIIYFLKGESYLILSGYYPERFNRSNRPLKRENAINLSYYYLNTVADEIIWGFYIPKHFKEINNVYAASDTLNQLKNYLYNTKKSLESFYSSFPEARVIEIKELRD